MQTIILYKYSREDGGVTVSPVKPENCTCAEMVRLVADDGKVLTRDGEDFVFCVDVTSADGWYEIEAEAKWSTNAEQIKPLSEEDTHGTTD